MDKETALAGIAKILDFYLADEEHISECTDEIFNYIQDIRYGKKGIECCGNALDKK